MPDRYVKTLPIAAMWLGVLFYQKDYQESQGQEL